MFKVFELTFIFGCLKTVSLYEEAGLKLTEHRDLSAFARIKAYTTTPNCMFGFGGRGNVGLLKVGTFYTVILI